MPDWGEEENNTLQEVADHDRARNLRTQSLSFRLPILVPSQTSSLFSFCSFDEFIEFLFYQLFIMPVENMQLLFLKIMLH